MSSKKTNDEEVEEVEEWEYFEEEKKVAEREKLSIKDILKIVFLFIIFACFFVYFRYWDALVDLFTFGSENPELGQSRMIYITLILFPLAASLFLVSMVDVSKKLFIPKKEPSREK